MYATDEQIDFLVKHFDWPTPVNYGPIKHYDDYNDIPGYPVSQHVDTDLDCNCDNCKLN